MDKNKKIALLIIGVFLFIGVVSSWMGGNQKTEQSRSQEIDRTEKAQKQPEEAKQKLIFKNEGKEEDNYYFLINTEDYSQENLELVSKDLKSQHCNKKCRIHLYNDKKAFDLLNETAKLTIEEEEKIFTENYEFIANHYLGYLDVDDKRAFVYFLYKDRRYLYSEEMIYMLAPEEIKLKNDSIILINGFTNLPINSLIDVSIHRPIISSVHEEAGYHLIGGTSFLVDKNGFSGEVDFSDKKTSEFVKAIDEDSPRVFDYLQIKIKFDSDPSRQQPNVVDKIGKSGEKLEGSPQLKVIGELTDSPRNILEITRTKHYDFLKEPI